MRPLKNILFLLFVLFFNQAFSQKKFKLTLSLDSSINSKNISCNYNNGKDLVFVKDTFVNKLLKIDGDIYSKFVSFEIDYTTADGRSLSNTFFINDKPATIHFTGKMADKGNQLAYDSIQNATSVFDTSTNKIWKGLSIYREKQAMAVSELFQKHQSEIGRIDSITLLSQKLYKDLNDRSISFLKKYPNEYFSFWWFSEQIVKPSISLMPTDTSYLRSLIVSFESIFPTMYTKSVEGQQIISKLEGLIQSQEKNLVALPFSMKDLNGNMVHLSDFKGKYILLDFWASWCGPCRINNPILKKIHDKYQNSKFKLISISADEENDKWKEAVRKDDMTWLNISDLKGVNSKVAIQYGIIAYPTYILVDPAGKIIMRTVNEIEKIQEKISAIFTTDK